MRRFALTMTSLITSAVLLAGCAATATTTNSTTTTSTSSTSGTTSTTTVDTTLATANVDWDDLPTTEVTLTDKGLTIAEAGTYVLSGSTTGQVVVDTDGYVRIILNGATITSSTGAAIQVDSAETTVIELADGTTNTVSDAATRSDEEIDGAIYSADDLIITGTGTLNLTANFADGIVGKDDLLIESGTIAVTSADDGIRGKDSLTVTGGTITITAQSPFDFDGTGTLTGGTIPVNGEQVTELTNQMMGGGGGRPGA